MSSASDFKIENGVLVKYVGPGGDVVIPEGVTEIGIKAFVRGGFEFSSTVTSIRIPHSVVMIRVGAFCGCWSLKSVTMHAGVTIERDYSGRRVGVETFGDCRSIKEIVFSKDCDDAVLNQFWEYFVVKSTNNTEKSMKAATLYSLLKYCPDYVLDDPEKAKKIKSGKKLLVDMCIELDDAETMAKAFSLHKNIKLEELNEYIEKSGNTVNVKAYLLDYKEKAYSSKTHARKETIQAEKQLAIRKMTVTDWKKVYQLKKREGGIAVLDYKGADQHVIVPEQIGKDRVVAIGAEAFSLYDEDYQLHENRMGLESVVIPESVTDIEGNAFSGCPNLASVTIPTSLKTIGYKAFSECQNLAQLHIPSGVVKIGYYAFDKCEKLTIYAPVGSYAEEYARKNNVPFVAE